MKKIPEEMENLILEMLQKGEKYKAITARTGVTETTVRRVARDSAWRYTDDNRFGYAYVWEQAKILKMISDKLREKDVPVPEVKLIGLW